VYNLLFKGGEGSKSSAIVDAVREEVGSFLRGRDPLGEEARILPDKRAQDPTTQTEFSDSFGIIQIQIHYLSAPYP